MQDLRYYGWTNARTWFKRCGPTSGQNLDALRLDPRKTRIYQDGLPVCGFEERIVRELAHAGSSNHQLILRWLEQSAVLMGTEDARLLLEEYEMQRQRLTQEPGRNLTPEEQHKRLHRLLEARDSFIAERIAATLQEARGGAAVPGRPAPAGRAAVHRYSGGDTR